MKNKLLNMKKNLKLYRLPLFVALVFSIGTSNAWAANDTNPTVTINGIQVEETLSKITFDGDHVILHFNANDSQQSEDMEDVTITWNQTAGISSIKTYQNLSNITGNTLNLQGIAPGERIELFDTSGKKCFQTRVSSESITLPLEHLTKGIYIIKVGHTFIKFQKK
ncbi:MULTISPECIES: T9SS type A sorting domain-containing protein [Segatella]|uniref:Uncharacterized protein n=2 Tax=Segatella TaxID=2974251 RepID=D8DY65_9BACT|nr:MULTISPECIES: T9SS type A sorting domain-containing protein [Segatella]MBQ3857666.1 T9SS type A sorting domain-containing protein [Prevotella sp.]EFI71617.1 hypothetical protein PBR_2103 [Segatella baroniae B14]MEE3414958.1 T9SS type A sorting domain-containing protein [Prevotella sp.]UKK78433.1 T9SS type A sorting domain-containing protein [Segatella baroniae B14]SEQ84299.1 Por secretion system C-terminal sorting domain-containing protein [Segatella baroniae B14]